MTKGQAPRRDREVTRFIHRLFWEAALRSRRAFIVSGSMHIVGFVLQNVLVPVAIAYGIQAIVTRQFDNVPELALLVIVLTLGYNIATAFASLSFNIFSSNGGEYVQKKVFENYLQKDYDFFTTSYFGSLGSQATRLRDASIEYNLSTFFDIPRQVVNIGAALIVISWHSVPLALLTLLCMGVVLSVTIASSAFRLKYRRLVSEASSEIAGAVGDSLSHGATVKSFASEAYEAKLLSTPLSHWKHLQRKSWNLFLPANAARTMLGAVTIAILLVVTANMYESNSISIATVTLVQIYVIRMIMSTMEISEMIKYRETTMGAAYQPATTMLVERRVLDKPETKKLPGTDRMTVEFDQVDYRYDEAAKNLHAVREFELRIEPGQKVGIVGYSGSGKTTLTKLLLRFMDVTEGAIRINGVDIRDLAQADLRNHIAYVPQEPLLFHRNIKDNIAYAKPEASDERIRRAAKLSHVDEFVNELSNGYDTFVGERGVKLSGGQRQRVAIARALLKNAPILVLDEATSALDSRSEKFIQQALWELMKNRTALVIAHRLSTIQRMDSIVVMHKGKVVEVGTHEQLLKNKKGIYAELWAHQSGGYVGASSNAEIADGVTDQN